MPNRISLTARKGLVAVDMAVVQEAMETAGTRTTAVARVVTVVQVAQVGQVGQVATRKKKVLPRSGILTGMTAPNVRIVQVASQKKRATDNASARIVLAVSLKRRAMVRSADRTVQVVTTHPSREIRAEDVQVLA